MVELQVSITKRRCFCLKTLKLLLFFPQKTHFPQNFFPKSAIKKFCILNPYNLQNHQTKNSKNKPKTPLIFLLKVHLKERDEILHLIFSFSAPTVQVFLF
ncbi:MAG: hypothetical protein ACRC37_00560 [Lentisphaeria bacterium]